MKQKKLKKLAKFEAFKITVLLDLQEKFDVIEFPNKFFKIRNNGKDFDYYPMAEKLNHLEGYKNNWFHVTQEDLIHFITNFK